MRLSDGLPELEGRWLAAYKLLWWTMLAITLVALTVGQWRHWQESSRTDLQIYSAGLLPDEHGGELTRVSVETSAPVGAFTGWTPARTVTQWALTR